jgi:glycyl-tRNA synthetase
MQNIFEINGLVFWNEEEIRQREFFRDYFARKIQTELQALNPQWSFHFVEAPLLNPRDLLNVNYTAEDIWEQESFVSAEEQAAIQAGKSPAPRHLALRPETTPGSYAYAQHLLNNHTGVKAPFVVWQAGKSFRREIVQPTKHMRLKEFYQQEFQCVFTADTANDYQEAMLEPVRKMIASVIALPTRLVESDRLPAYSKRTMDVEVWNGDKWMEVCSISLRTDFPQTLVFQGKKGQLEKDALVLEVAIGLDRCVYNWQQAQRDDINRTPPDNWMEEEEAIAETEAQPT